MSAPTTVASPPLPLRHCYWVVPGLLLAGEHPGAPTRDKTKDRLKKLLAAGIECFVDLTKPTELQRYDTHLPFYVEYARKSIKDHGVPGSREQMVEILEHVGNAMRAGRPVYVHCRAGIGRTGTVIGCLLVERGLSGDRALDELNQLWQQSRRSKNWAYIPETEAQADYIRHWQPSLTSSGFELNSLASAVAGVGPMRAGGSLAGGGTGAMAGGLTGDGGAGPRGTGAGASSGAGGRAGAGARAGANAGSGGAAADRAGTASRGSAADARLGAFTVADVQSRAARQATGAGQARAALNNLAAGKGRKETKNSSAGHAAGAGLTAAAAQARAAVERGQAPAPSRVADGDSVGGRGGAADGRREGAADGSSSGGHPAQTRVVAQQPGSLRAAPAHTESRTADVLRADAAPADSSRAEPLGPEVMRSEPALIEPAVVEAVRGEAARVELARGGTPRAEGPRAELSPIAPSQVESLLAEPMSARSVPFAPPAVEATQTESVPAKSSSSSAAAIGTAAAGTSPADAAGVRVAAAGTSSAGPAAGGTAAAGSAVQASATPSATPRPVEAHPAATRAAGAHPVEAHPASTHPAAEFDPLLDPATLAVARHLRERFVGTLFGLAVGDAVAAATQFRRPGSFTPVGDMLGGGPFDLPRGAWSDDTAMALCLAESLLECDGFDPRDQVQRYGRWQQEGYLSSTGQCVGITASTARSLAIAKWRRVVFPGSHDPEQLDPEPLSRVVSVALFYFASLETTLQQAADSSRTTCQAPAVLDACRRLGRALNVALSGQPKDLILAEMTPITAAAAQRNSTAATALAAAFWAFSSTDNFRDAILRAANVGGNSDVVASVCGQLAGAHYGMSAIPPSWRNGLMQKDLIEGYADRMLAHGLISLSA
jgi:ADP-ribosyl-[dinitrogen reductase] hydrolase